jgi:hypothetical protein
LPNIHTNYYSTAYTPRRHSDLSGLCVPCWSYVRSYFRFPPGHPGHHWYNVRSAATSQEPTHTPETAHVRTPPTGQPLQTRLGIDARRRRRTRAKDHWRPQRPRPRPRGRLPSQACPMLPAADGRNELWCLRGGQFIFALIRLRRLPILPRPRLFALLGQPNLSRQLMFTLLKLRGPDVRLRQGTPHETSGPILVSSFRGLANQNRRYTQRPNGGRQQGVKQDGGHGCVPHAEPERNSGESR